MTPRRTVRVDDATWEAWERAAMSRGFTVSMLIRDAVNASLERPALTFASDLAEPPAEPAREPSTAARKTRRTGMCEHRNPPHVYCSRCD